MAAVCGFSSLSTTMRRMPKCKCYGSQQKNSKSLPQATADDILTVYMCCMPQLFRQHTLRKMMFYLNVTDCKYN